MFDLNPLESAFVGERKALALRLSDESVIKAEKYLAGSPSQQRSGKALSALLSAALTQLEHREPSSDDSPYQALAEAITATRLQPKVTVWVSLPAAQWAYVVGLRRVLSVYYADTAVTDTDVVRAVVCLAMNEVYDAKFAAHH